MSMTPTLLDEIVGHNVKKLEGREGQTSQIASLRLTWKARGEDTGYQFAVYEMTLAPDVGIPLHKHPYAEFFYVLEGQIDFERLSETGVVEWISCDAGGCVTAPANAPHTFHNHTSQPAKFLSVSSYYHQVMLDSGGVPVKVYDPLSTDVAPSVFEKFVRAATEAQVYVVHA